MKKTNDRAPRRKWKHLENFSLQEDGKYTYSGDHMLCELPPDQYRRQCAKMLSVSCAVSALLAAAGCFPQTGMEGNALLLIPYVFSLAAGLLLCCSVFMIKKSGPRLRQYQYEKEVYAVSRRSAEGILGSTAGLAGWLVCIVRHTYPGTGTGSILLRLSFLAGSAGFLFVHRLNSRITWKAEQKQRSGQQNV